MVPQVWFVNLGVRSVLPSSQRSNAMGSTPITFPYPAGGRLFSFPNVLTFKLATFNVFDPAIPQQIHDLRVSRPAARPVTISPTLTSCIRKTYSLLDKYITL